MAHLLPFGSTMMKTRSTGPGALFATLFSAVLLLVAPGARAGLILHSSMDDAQAIFRPETATGLYATMGEAIPGPAYTTFEAGQVGTAARFDIGGFDPVWPVDGPVRFHGDNFDFDDPDQDGGRLDFWVKFNEDPHSVSGNSWLARTNWGERYINYEWAAGSGSHYFMIDVYAEVAHNYRTNYSGFRVSPQFWSVYDDIQAGEWHVFTFTWRNNGGLHRDEIHLYIDGTQAGCQSCNDYNGNLPPVDSITDFFFSPYLIDNYMLFTIDEVYSFDSWDYSGITGNFPELQIPEGLVMKFPQDNRYPVWGSSIPNGDIAFEFTVNDYQNESCDCELWVDDQYQATVNAVSGAHTEIYPPAPVPKGTHTWQMRCDGGRLVSEVVQFSVDADVPVQKRSVTQTKKLYSPQRH